MARKITLLDTTVLLDGWDLGRDTAHTFGVFSPDLRTSEVTFSLSYSGFSGPRR